MVKRGVCQGSRACLQCQIVKVHRDTKAQFAKFHEAITFFHHVHVYLLGPLLPPHGNVYIPTCVDHSTRWPQAISVPCPTSEVAANPFLACWAGVFDSRAVVTGDCGPHRDEAFLVLVKTIACKHTRTTDCHPQANGK